MLETVLHQRVAYSHAVIDGRSVHEYEPEGAGAAEIDDLYTHITRSYGAVERKSKQPFKIYLHLAKWTSRCSRGPCQISLRDSPVP